MNVTEVLVVVLLGILTAGGVYYYWTTNTVEAPVIETAEEAATPDLTNNNEPMNILTDETTETEADITPINQEVKVTLVTNKGNINLVLDGTRAPMTVGNFVKLAQADFYDGTTFHRVIKDFMIQGGDPLSKDANQRARHGTGGPGYQFADEINAEPLVRGSLAMANAGTNTNGSQFFIVTAESTPWLDGKHTNFGQVADEESMAVVDSIQVVQTDENDNPVNPVTVQDVLVEI